MNDVIEETYLSTNGIRLHAVQAGPADGPLVVMLHGFPEFWRSWSKQIPPLAAAGYRVLAPDQRGYNLSDCPRDVRAYRADELAKDVIGLLDALGRQTCYLVGHDWGAAVAWYLALAYPQRVEKLVILNVPHPAVMQAFWRGRPAQMLKSWYVAFFQIPRLPEWAMSANDFAPALRSLRASSRPGTFSDEDIAAYRQAWKNSGGLSGMLNWYRAIRYSPAAPEDIRVHMPVRILWGKQDAFLSHQMAAESARLCDQAEVTLYEQATHWLQHEEPQAVTAELLAFFARRG